MSTYPYTGEAFTPTALITLSAQFTSKFLVYHYVLSLRIQVNQSLSRFSLTIQSAANNAGRCSKAQKKRRFSRRCPEPRDVWSVSSKLTHKGNAFMRLLFEKGGRKLFCCLLPQSVHNGAAKLLNCPSLSPCASTGETFTLQSSRCSARERLPLSKFSPGLFQKAAYPRVSPRSPRHPCYSSASSSRERTFFAVVVYGDIG